MKHAFSLLLCVLALTTASCRGSHEQRPNVLLIVVDTLRADRLGCYGNGRGLTPFLDSLAARGTVFANAYAPSSWTVPSVASLFTSRYPSQHGATTFESKLSVQEVTLAEQLSLAGYATGGLSANFRLSLQHGYAQGFQHWRAYVPPRADLPLVRGDRLRRDVLAWFSRTRDEMRGRPMFLYLQYMEPHSPYDPPEPYRTRFGPAASAEQVRDASDKLARLRFPDLTDEEVKLLQALYDAEVASVDEEIRRLLDRLERRGFLRNAVVVITADHGEEFGEHRVFSHGYSLYQEGIRVPLIVVAPGVPAGRVVSRNVSLLDVAPTVLQLVGLPPQERFEGRSLVPLLEDATSGDSVTDGNTDLLSELPPAGGKLDLRRHERVLLRESRKLAVTPDGSAVLYDLLKDPREKDPLGEDAADDVGVLEQALAKLLAGLEQSASPVREKAEVDEATREKLRALGYHD